MSQPPPSAPVRRLRLPRLSPKGRQTVGLWVADVFKVAAGAIGAASLLPNLLTGRSLFTVSAVASGIVVVVLAVAAFLAHYMSAERLGEDTREETSNG